MNFAPGGDTYFTCVVNSSVHVAMCVLSYIAVKSFVEAHCAVCMLADQDSRMVFWSACSPIRAVCLQGLLILS